ncbi:short-chain collagen C4-like isoform X2 [Saccostrea cucullata]|uniref:short-chain collagen C4-like isoform X2 n=1 Tax=Saccostrea cuccullata TaxID=36930 RepID=UPI002ED38D73
MEIIITIPILLYLSSFSVINGELSVQNSVTTEKCKYSDVKQELDAVRQLLNQETLIRMSLERSLKDLTKEVEEWKKTNDCVNKTITPDYKSNYDTRKNGNPTYVRWGKSTCSNGSTLVYAGQVGGTKYNVKGGAANPLCLTFDVLWGNRTKTTTSSNLHGAEYETNFWGTNFHNTDVPCAVCQVKTRTHVLMIPGRNQCLKGWTEEYHGYISSESRFNDKSRGFYTCVDDNPEQIMGGGTRNDDGYLFYSVLAKCGSLKCPPYIDDKPITCVVCSQ